VRPGLPFGLLPAWSLFKVLFGHGHDDGVSIRSSPHGYLIPRDSDRFSAEAQDAADRYNRSFNARVVWIDDQFIDLPEVIPLCILNTGTDELTAVYFINSTRCR
jgi:hypothetical protein